MKREILDHRNINCATRLIKSAYSLFQSETNAIKRNCWHFKSKLLNEIKFQIITFSQIVLHRK